MLICFSGCCLFLPPLCTKLLPAIFHASFIQSVKRSSATLEPSNLQATAGPPVSFVIYVVSCLHANAQAVQLLGRGVTWMNSVWPSTEGSGVTQGELSLRWWIILYNEDNVKQCFWFNTRCIYMQTFPITCSSNFACSVHYQHYCWVTTRLKLMWY